MRRAAAVAAVLWSALAAVSHAGPATDYALHCRGCHGPDGGGAGGAVPSFRNHLARFVGVPGGREYLVRVPGTAQSELSDARLAALLNWMLREYDGAHLPADFTPFAEEEVGRWRRRPLVQVEEVRAMLLEQLR